MIKLRQPSWPKQNSVGAPSVKKVPQGGSCISIKLVSWNGVAFAVTPFFLCCARWGAAGRLLPFPPGSVRAEYPIRTVIQLSGRLFALTLINWEFIFDLNEVNFVNFPQTTKRAGTQHIKSAGENLSPYLWWNYVPALKFRNLQCLLFPSRRQTLQQERRSRNLFRRLPCVSFRYSIVDSAMRARYSIAYRTFVCQVVLTYCSRKSGCRFRQPPLG